jgi:formylglycine-generating enzyme required for sulfatase activity
MVRINGGTFTMGSPVTDPESSGDESPQHKVTVSSFYMGKYEVTQKEYREVMGINMSGFKGDNLPVENVTWFDAVEYCNKRSQKEGLTPAYTISGRTPATGYSIRAATVTWNRNANGYRLPTEAEWEYACRAGTTTAYNTGASINNNTGWYDANSSKTTHPVGQKSANAWGLYDMHGNVWEWCWDWYGYYARGGVQTTAGPDSGTERVSRGGSWLASAQVVRSAFRFNVKPSFQSHSTGFRVVRNAQ